MKRANDQVRVPSHSRYVRVDSSTLRDQSLGDTLRKARKVLIIQQLIGILFVFALVIAIITIAYMGYFGKLIQYLIDRLMQL